MNIPTSKLKLNKNNPSWVVRSKTGKFKRIDNYNMKVAIAAQCTECIGYDEDEVKNCSSIYCALYPYRDFLEGGLSGGVPSDPRISSKRKKADEADV